MTGRRVIEAGAVVFETGVDFALRSFSAGQVELCLFDEAGRSYARLPMERDGDHVFRLFVDGLKEGARYGYRADGPYAPDQGLWFDPAKLLVDPYAKEIDAPFRYDPRLSVFGEDTADLVPKAIVTRDRPVARKKPLLTPGGFVYELAVRPFTMLHPDVPASQRGTLSALAHPAVIAHLKRIGVDAVELLPITAWIDERHLPPLGLTNGWGYNPIAMMALDPRLAPGGTAELARTVAALQDAGIGVILDLVFNHSGESDRLGATLSMRGIDNPTYYRHMPDRPGDLINDTGTGNTLNCDHPTVQRLILDSLRHFVLNAGVDGFRFDLAPVIGRTPEGFQRDGGTLSAILADEALADRVMIAEPWDIGPGGYQLGNFPAPFLEWNDRARDDIRRYWRGDFGMTGALATALAGSADIFSHHGATATRSVNFIAAHDGFTLKDLVSYSHKHNEANGEDNRDGHNENHSWNNGAEGPTDLPDVEKRRRRDVMALLSTLFASRGTVMLTAGDEGGRSQRGNNNAYCQDNAITWLDWSSLDEALVAHTAFLSDLRRRFPVLSEQAFLDESTVEWISFSGRPMTVADWERGDLPGFGMLLAISPGKNRKRRRLAVLVNRSADPHGVTLPPPGLWCPLLPGGQGKALAQPAILEARSVGFFVES